MNMHTNGYLLNAEKFWLFFTQLCKYKDIYMVIFSYLCIQEDQNSQKAQCMKFDVIRTSHQPCKKLQWLNGS